jgi:hypothetical protein
MIGKRAATRWRANGGERDGTTMASSTAATTGERPSGPRRGTPARVAYLYNEHVVATGRENAFLVAAAFLIAFGVVRFITHSIRAHRLRWLFHDVQTANGPHIHHLVFGIVGLLAVGYIATAFPPQRPWLKRLLAIAFGISAALTLDEFALWLNLQDVYWTRQGRESVDAVMVFGALAALAAAGRAFARAMWHDFCLIVRDVVRLTFANRQAK